MHCDIVVDDMWNRIRERLTSANVMLVREVRRLIDLPPSEAVAAIAPMLASKDVGRIRQVFTLFANVSQNLLANHGGGSGRTLARQQTATLLANQLGDRIKELGHPTKTLSPSENIKQDTYVELTRRLVSLADWTNNSEAAARQTIGELEILRAANPSHFFADEISEAIAIAWARIGDHHDQSTALVPATDAYRRAIEAFDETRQSSEARKVRLKLISLIRRLSVNFNETITQISLMLDEIEAEGPNLQRAQMHLALAETYVSIGDLGAARGEVAAAERDSWLCGWMEPDVNDIDRSFCKWVAHAESTFPMPDEFVEALFDEVSVEIETLALRARISLDSTERDACSRAVQQVADLEKRLRDTALMATNANSAEVATFLGEFGGTQFQEEGWLALPTDTRLGRLAELHATLDGAVDAVRAEFEAGAVPGTLLPKIDPIAADARAHGLTAVEAAALLLRADILTEGGCFEPARQAAREAFDLPRDPLRDLTTGLYALDRIITASIASNDTPAISAACNDAIALIERHRYNISAPYTQSAFLQGRARYYTMGMDTALRCDDLELLVQRAELFKAAGTLRNVGSPAGYSPGELAERFRALTDEIEQARQAGNINGANALAERRRRVWDRLVIERAGARCGFESAPFTLAALHAALDPDQAAVSWYWLSRDVLMVIAIDSRRIRATKCKVGEAERVALDEFAEAIQSLRGVASWIDDVSRFSATLLPKAIDPILEGKRRLILSPHRVLHALPLHALAWNGELLIRSFAISYAPNFSCLVRQHPVAQTKSALIVGVKDFEIPGERLKSLPDCLSEVEAIAALWAANRAATTQLPDDRATTSAVRSLAASGALERFACLHFATHGADVRGNNPMEAHLWLRDGRLDGLEIAMWQLQADLVVLSACHSGQRAIERYGTELMGDDIFGLQAALFTAGAARVLGALWPADSPTAALLMADFHERYAAGGSPEVSLQAAMLNCLDKATTLTRAAYYWAPFYIGAVARPVGSTV